MEIEIGQTWEKPSITVTGTEMPSGGWVSYNIEAVDKMTGRVSLRTIDTRRFENANYESMQAGDGGWRRKR